MGGRNVTSVTVIRILDLSFCEFSHQMLNIMIHCAGLGLLLHSCKIDRGILAYDSLTEMFSNRDL